MIRIGFGGKERRPSSEYCVYAVCRGVSLGRISGSPGGRRGLCEDFSPLRPLRIRGDGGCRLCGRRFPDPKKKYISGYFVLAWEKTGRIRILRYRESAYRSCERLAGFCGRGRRAEKNTVGRTDSQTETPEREPRGAGMYRDCRTQTAISVLAVQWDRSSA